VAGFEVTGNRVHPLAPSQFPTVTEVHEADSDFTALIIKSPDGRLFKTHNELVLGPHLSAVYSGDFNNDDAPDFLAVKPDMGCGLAAEYSTGVFAFSNGRDGY
jgi:hypothetical protein